MRWNLTKGIDSSNVYETLREIDWGNTSMYPCASASRISIYQCTLVIALWNQTARLPMKIGLCICQHIDKQKQLDEKII